MKRPGWMSRRMLAAAVVLMLQLLALAVLPGQHGLPWFDMLMLACAAVVLALCVLDWLDLRRKHRKHREHRDQPEPLDSGLTFRNARLVALDPEGKPTGPAVDLGSGAVGLAAPDEMAYQPVEYLRPWGRDRLTPQAIHGPWISARDILPPGECAIHGPEDIPPNPYLVCGECGHAYATVQALVDEHNRLLQQMSEQPQPIIPPVRPFTAEEVEAFKQRSEEALQRMGRAVGVPPAILAGMAEPPVPWEPVEYRPLSYDQVDLIICCPFCTHDW